MKNMTLLLLFLFEITQQGCKSDTTIPGKFEFEKELLNRYVLTYENSQFQDIFLMKSASENQFKEVKMEQVFDFAWNPNDTKLTYQIFFKEDGRVASFSYKEEEGETLKEESEFKLYWEKDQIIEVTKEEEAGFPENYLTLKYNEEGLMEYKKDHMGYEYFITYQRNDEDLVDKSVVHIKKPLYDRIADSNERYITYFSNDKNKAVVGPTKSAPSETSNWHYEFYNNGKLGKRYRIFIESPLRYAIMNKWDKAGAQIAVCYGPNTPEETITPVKNAQGDWIKTEKSIFIPSGKQYISRTITYW